MQQRLHRENLQMILFIFVSQMLLRAVLFTLQYRGLNYFGGDSGMYYLTAEDLSRTNHFWPLGWPLLLKGFLFLNHSAYSLLFLQTAFAILTQVLFVSVLRTYAKASTRKALLFSALFFYNPAWVRLNSLFLMADTLVVLFVITGIYYGLRLLEMDRQKNQALAFSFLLGCATFFKLVLRVLCLPLLLALMWKSWRHKQKAHSVALLFMFLTGPALYVALLEWPRHHSIDYDRFSGYSLFANVIPFTDCEKLRANAPAGVSAETLQEICTDNAVHMESPQQLWSTESFLGRAQEDLFAGQSRAEINQLLSQWSRTLILNHPETLAKAAARNLGFYFTATRQDSLSYSGPSSWALAEKTLQDFFGESVESYKNETQKFLDQNSFGVQFADQISQWMNLALRWAGSLGLVIILVMAVKRKENPSATRVAVLALIYGAAITVAGFYEPRAYIVLDMLLVLSLGLSRIPYRTYPE